MSMSYLIFFGTNKLFYVLNLQKMEQREKLELAVREREKSRYEAIQKKWSRREENEFLRVLTGYGIDLLSHTPVPTPDWSRFKTLAKLEKKSDESMSDYYKVFIAMSKRQAGVKLTEEEKGLEGIIDDISEDHARLVLDRLELLSKLRETYKYTKLDERLLLCQRNLDTPDWWESGKHDKELIKAVLRHGLYNSEHFILNDPEYIFYDVEKKFTEDVELHNLKTITKFEEAAELLKHNKNEILVKLEKGEGTLKIEKVQKELDDIENKLESKIETIQEETSDELDTVEEFKNISNPESNVEMEEKTVEEVEKKIEEELQNLCEEPIVELHHEEHKVIDDTDKIADIEIAKTIETLDEHEKNYNEPGNKILNIENLATESDRDSPNETICEKTTLQKLDEKSDVDECIKQAEELKARFPDLEVIQPTQKSRQMDSNSPKDQINALKGI